MQLDDLLVLYINENNEDINKVIYASNVEESMNQYKNTLLV